MKLLSLNCRGLGQSEAVREVRSLVQLHCPEVVFLSETRRYSNDVQSLRSNLGFANGVGVGTLGRGGGLALLWTNEVCVKLQSYDRNHIDVIVVDPITGAEWWRFTGFYGEARKENRHRSWELMHYLNAQSNTPWLCAGDFNEILDAREQFGGVQRPKRQMDGFRDAVSACGFSDLGFIGPPYTRDNRQGGTHNIKVRLNRGFANAAFANLFNHIKVCHEQTVQSDHCCLVIECNRYKQNKGKRRKNFKYENMWRRDLPTYSW